ARKHQQQITIREIKFRPKIAQNDYDTKKGHVTRFLKHKDKVKVTIMFRGREVTHPERGVALLERLAEELAELAVVEQRPIQDGRNMTMMLGPSKAVLAEGTERRVDEAAKPAADAQPAAAAEDAGAAAPAEARPAAEDASAAEPAVDASASAPAADTNGAEADGNGAEADASGAEADGAGAPQARRAAARRAAPKRAAAR
ncbi:MAG TPA: translation initiation factor IF-3, partial [Conexibacter sp.]|nr:translation initiation factor IF-3 [Conexibacter sp.]